MWHFGDEDFKSLTSYVFIPNNFYVINANAGVHLMGHWRGSPNTKIFQQIKKKGNHLEVRNE